MLFIFDMGGVVTNTFNINSLYEKLQISKNQFLEICKFNQRNIWHEMEIGELDTMSFWRLFNNTIKENKFNIPEVKNDLFRLSFHPSKNIETVNLINNLKKDGHRVVCGTNTIQSHWENHMERGDYSFFNQTYASNKIGIAKPDSDFFRIILEAEGYKAEETFFTDDKIENCQAAANLGIHAYHFDNATEYEKYIKSILLG